MCLVLDHSHKERDLTNGRFEQWLSLEDDENKEGEIS